MYQGTQMRHLTANVHLPVLQRTVPRGAPAAPRSCPALLGSGDLRQARVPPAKPGAGSKLFWARPLHFWKRHQQQKGKLMIVSGKLQ